MEHIIPAWMLIPFAVQLLCIAILPLTKWGEWWEHNTHKLLVSLLLGLPVAAVLCLQGLTHEIEHQMLYDYVPFILLLPRLLGVTGIYFSQPAADLLTVLACLLLIRPMKRTASKNMTGDSQ